MAIPTDPQFSGHDLRQILIHRTNDDLSNRFDFLKSRKYRRDGIFRFKIDYQPDLCWLLGSSDLNLNF
jgi:hypothetical protein